MRVTAPRTASMKHPIVLIFQRTIGMILLCIGLVGLFIPFVPIWMLLIPGIAFLGHNDPVVRALHLSGLRLMKSGKQHKSLWIRRLGNMTYATYRQMRHLATIILDRWHRYTTKPPPPRA